MAAVDMTYMTTVNIVVKTAAETLCLRKNFTNGLILSELLLKKKWVFFSGGGEHNVDK